MNDTENKKYYIRFGAVPKNEKSGVITCGEKITTNVGVPVFDAFYNEGKWQPVLPVPCRKSTVDTINRFMMQSPLFRDPIFLVTGDKVGTGFDGEPLIVNVTIIRNISYQFSDVYDVQSKDGISINLWLGNDVVEQIKKYLDKNTVVTSDIYEFIASRIALHETKNFGVIDLKTLPKSALCPLRRTLSIETDEIRVADFIFFMEALNSRRVRYIRGIGPVIRDQLNEYYTNMISDNNFQELIAEIHDFFKNLFGMMDQRELYTNIVNFKKRYGYE